MPLFFIYNRFVVKRYKFSSFAMSSTVDIQDLVDCFDDIPDLMKTMHKLTKSCPSIHPGDIISIQIMFYMKSYQYQYLS